MTRPPRTILFLGGAEIRVAGEPVSGRAVHRHRIGLLALLVAANGRAISRDKAMAYLWPERDTDAARNLLKVSIHELRKELGDEAIRSVGDQISIDPNAVQCDVIDLEGALAAGNDAAIAAQYKGAFLDGFFLKEADEFMHWVDAERLRLATASSAAFERLLASAEKGGDADAAAEWSRRILAIDPFKADVALRHIKALVASGNAAGAIRFAGQFVERRKNEIGIDDKEGIVAAARTLAQNAGVDVDTLSFEYPQQVGSLQPTATRNLRTPTSRFVALTVVAAVILALIVAALKFTSSSADDIDTVVAGRPELAARHFIAARSAYAAARYAEAESLYAKSLDADSTFAAAGLGLAMANSWTTINENYGRGRDAAKKYESSLSARDRVFFRAFFGPDPQFAPSQPAPAYLAAWEDVVEKYPDWAEAWYQLGDRYYHFGGLSGLADNLDRARTAFTRARARDAKYAAPLHHLVELYAETGDEKNLRTASDEFFAANPSVQRDRSAMGWEVAFALGDSAWLRRVRTNLTSFAQEDLRRIGWITNANGWPAADADSAARLLVKAGTTSSERERAYWLQFTLAANAGDEKGAIAAAEGLQATFPDRPIGAAWKLFLDLFGDGERISTAQGLKDLDRFVDGAPAGDHVRREHRYEAMCAVGLQRSLVRDDVGAARVLTRLKAEIPREENNWTRRSARLCAALLAADAAVRAGKPDARALVGSLDTLLLSERVPPSILLEVATIRSSSMHAELGDVPGALAAARRREHLTGDPFFRSTQLLQEGKFAEQAGDKDGAVKAYRRFLLLRSGQGDIGSSDAAIKAQAALSRLAPP